jgi:hypothetical protein
MGCQSMTFKAISKTKTKIKKIRKRNCNCMHKPVPLLSPPLFSFVLSSLPLPLPPSPPPSPSPHPTPSPLPLPLSLYSPLAQRSQCQEEECHAGEDLIAIGAACFLLGLKQEKGEGEGGGRERETNDKIGRQNSTCVGNDQGGIRWQNNFLGKFNRNKVFIFCFLFFIVICTYPIFYFLKF